MTASAFPQFLRHGKTTPHPSAAALEIGKALDRVQKISAVIIVLTGAFALVSTPGGIAPTLVIHGCFALFLISSHAYLRAGRRRMAGAVLAGGFWLVSTGTVFAFGGVHSPGLFVYLPVMVTAALFWTRGAALFLATASVLVVLVAVMLEEQGALPTPLPFPPVRLWAVFTGSLVMTAVLLLSALRRLKALAHDVTRSRSLLEDISKTQKLAAKERKELESRLVNMERLETVGRLAGGVAHDFNNLLSVILNSATILRRELPRDSLEADLVGEIDEATSRATELVRKLLNAPAQTMRTPAPVDLNALVVGLTFMLRRLAGPRTELVLATQAVDAIVQADASDLEQVILNLALNARDAMPRGGRLRIETRGVAPSDAPGPAGHGTAYVALVVADEGVGMDPVTAGRIFEPFFTTKGATGGTGVGLANVKRIIDETGGRIRVETSPGGGTRIEVLLPLAYAA